MHRFIGLGLRHGILDHAGAGLHHCGAVLDVGRADDDAVIHGSIAAQVSHRPAIGAAALSLRATHQFGGAQFGSSGERSHVHARTVGMEGIEVRVERRRDAGDQVHDP